MFKELNEECGIFGIYTKDKRVKVAEEAYLALYALQHRGEESCGIAVNNEGIIVSHKDLGLVHEVFNPSVMKRLEGGQIAIGHTQYAKIGMSSRENAQPLVTKYKKGTLALAHNGSLVNTNSLRLDLEESGAIFQTTSDSEVMLYILAKERILSHTIEEAILKMMDKIKGAYSLVIMSPRKLIAVRDPQGFRPLCMGSIDDTVIFASESCALDALGAKFIRDIEPGEVVVVDNTGIKSLKKESKKTGLCVFEFIYFARPDSVIDGASVHLARQEAGKYLAEQYPVEADIVCGVPDSGLDAALGYSRQSGIPYGFAFVKNRYVGRTFIQTCQTERERSVKIKLNVLKSSVEGKRVVLIDDSIVRGTTTANTVKLLKEAGAKEVHMRISSPPFLHPCYFGTDIDSRENLIAHKMTVDEICKTIGADSLGYLSLENVTKIPIGSNRSFCSGCFSGKYPIEVPETVK